MRYIKEFYRFIGHIIENKRLLWNLVKNDFRQTYLGSFFGIFWAFAQPMAMILILWFVFEVGFRVGPTDRGVPFILWLMSGMIPWFFFANSVSGGMMSVVSNAFLVKKICFRVSILPLVNITSALMIHLFFVLVLAVIFMVYGYSPTIYWLQLPFYILCVYFLVMGISWLLSSLIVFSKDVGQFVNILLQFGFWATPIFWSIKMVPEKYLYLIKLNPMFFIVDGYRDVFINHIWFWEKYRVTPYFMLTTVILFIAGAVIFKRLRPHFADVM